MVVSLTVQLTEKLEPLDAHTGNPGNLVSTVVVAITAEKIPFDWRTLISVLEY